MNMLRQVLIHADVSSAVSLLMLISKRGLGMVSVNKSSPQFDQCLTNTQTTYRC